MGYVPLNIDFEQIAADIRAFQLEHEMPDHLRELADAGIRHLRDEIPAALSDQDIARVALAIAVVTARLADRGPHWTGQVMANYIGTVGERLWHSAQDKPADEPDKAEPTGGDKDDPAFDALEKLHARIARDFHFDAAESAPPDDEHWARLMDDLVNYADELYLPFANARLGIASVLDAQPERATEGIQQ